MSGEAEWPEFALSLTPVRILNFPPLLSHIGHHGYNPYPKALPLACSRGATAVEPTWTFAILCSIKNVTIVFERLKKKSMLQETSKILSNSKGF
jgi:hypothetical protein